MRLNAISNSLGVIYRQASERQRRYAALTMCTASVAETGLEGIEIDTAIDAIRRGNSEFNVRSKIESVAELLDNQYFMITEEGNDASPEASLLFRRARAAAALWFALSPDIEQLHEAIYEAIHASNDQVEATQRAKVALGT